MNKLFSISLLIPVVTMLMVISSCQSSGTAKQGSGQLSQISNIFTSNSYYKYDTTEVYAYNDYTVFDKVTASLVYDKTENTAGIQYRSNLGGYNLLMNEATRRVLADAVKQYLSDFDNKILSRKTRASYKVYGEYPCRIEWGMFAQAASNYADTKMQMGYMFKNKSPYFTLTVWETKNSRYQVTTSNDEDLQTTYIFMTKEQAQDLCSKLSDEAVAAAAEKAAD
jgi:hypothetical protein